jgi:transposase-like protein
MKRQICPNCDSKQTKRLIESYSGVDRYICRVCDREFDVVRVIKNEMS